MQALADLLDVGHIDDVAGVDHEVAQLHRGRRHAPRRLHRLEAVTHGSGVNAALTLQQLLLAFVK